MARVNFETGYNPYAVAKPQNWKIGKGKSIYGSEIGLLQISPANRHDLGMTNEEATDWRININVGMKIWDKWVNNFYKEQKELPEEGSERDVWSWLVTSVGPGAIRKIRELTGNSYNLNDLRGVANDMETLEKYKKSWGTQSPKLIQQRILQSINIIHKVYGRQ